MRPVIKRGLRAVWRDHRTLQLGLDPARCVVLADLEPPAAAYVLGIDGSRTREQLLVAAPDHGLTTAEADVLLTALETARIVDDQTAVEAALATMSAGPRTRLREEVAAAALAASALGGGAEAVARRTSRSVLVVGGGRTAATTAVLLDAAGIRVDTSSDLAAEQVESTRGDAVVLASGGWPLPQLTAALTTSGVAHLPVTLCEGEAVVGPYVVPGRSPCLRCRSLHRTGRDPAWPLLEAQLAAPTTHEPAATATTEALAGALAARLVVAVLDAVGASAADGRVDPELVATAYVLPVGAPVPRPRPVPWHPACGCRWSAVA